MDEQAKDQLLEALEVRKLRGIVSSIKKLAHPPDQSETVGELRSHHPSSAWEHADQTVLFKSTETGIYGGQWQAKKAVRADKQIVEFKITPQRGDIDSAYGDLPKIEYEFEFGFAESRHKITLGSGSLDCRAASHPFYFTKEGVIDGLVDEWFSTEGTLLSFGDTPLDNSATVADVHLQYTLQNDGAQYTLSISAPIGVNAEGRFWIYEKLPEISRKEFFGQGEFNHVLDFYLVGTVYALPDSYFALAEGYSSAQAVSRIRDLLSRAPIDVLKFRSDSLKNPIPEVGVVSSGKILSSLHPNVVSGFSSSSGGD